MIGKKSGGGVDGQEEDEGQGGEEGRSEEDHPGCQVRAQDREGREEAAQGRIEDVPSEGRGARDRRVPEPDRPPPQLVAVSLLGPLISNRIARARLLRDAGDALPPTRGLVYSLAGF
jgi:hypothetical protein